MKRSIKNQILLLRSQGKSYNEICNKLNCSKGAVSYHLGDTQKEKTLIRTRKRRLNPIVSKLESFNNSKPRVLTKGKPLWGNYRILYLKLKAFFRDRKTMIPDKLPITIDQLINKIGPEPKCYLTGQLLDLNKAREFAFDHIIPVSRGGQNTLDNLGLCTKIANASKTDMTLDEYINLCKNVLENFGYKVSK